VLTLLTAGTATEAVDGTQLSERMLTSGVWGYRALAFLPLKSWPKFPASDQKMIGIDVVASTCSQAPIADILSQLAFSQHRTQEDALRM